MGKNVETLFWKDKYEKQEIFQIHKFKIISSQVHVLRNFKAFYYFNWHFYRHDLNTWK